MRPTVHITSRKPQLSARLLPSLTAILSIAFRGYLGFVWLRFALIKFQTGWLTTNPIRPLMTMIVAGLLPTTVPGYGYVARAITFTHADALLSIAIPFTEIAIAFLLFTGLRVRTAALVATALNVNLLLAGVASVSLDGRMIVLQLMLIALATLAPPPSRLILGAWRKSSSRKSSASSPRTGSRRSLAS